MNDQYLGSVESFFTFDYLINKSMKLDTTITYSGYLNSDKAELAWKLKDNEKLGEYISLTKKIDKKVKISLTEDILTRVKQEITDNSAPKEILICEGNIGILIYPLKDFNDDVIGINVVTHDFTQLFHQDFMSSLFLIIIGLLGMFVGILIIVLHILKTINRFQYISSTLTNVANNIENGNLDNVDNVISEFRDGLEVELVPIADSLQTASSKYREPINVLIDSINKISKGDTIEKVSGFKGDFETAQNSINTLDITIERFKEDLSIFSKNISNGEIDYRLDSAKQTGYWLELFELTNSVASEFSKPIEDLLLSIKDLSENRVTREIDTSKYNGAFKEYTTNVNGAIAKINDLIVNLANKSSVLSGASHNLDGVATNLKSTTDNMIDVVNGVASSIDEMNTNGNMVAAAVEEMSINANDVSNNATETLTYMENIATAVEEMSISMETISKNTINATKISEDAQQAEKETGEYIDKLDYAVTEISKVTDMIKKIAEQTNLLALNATIEAASAGEAGKGFAVVANEIKELASQSSKSADNIEAMVDEVQKATSGSVTKIKVIGDVIGKTKDIITDISESIDVQQKTVIDISENTSETLGRIKDVVGSINEVANVTNDASKNVGGISTGLGDVSSNMDNVKSLVTEAGSVVEKIMISGDNLNKTAAGLSETVSMYEYSGDVQEYNIDIIFPWDLKVFDVGSKFVNDQHKVLVDLINGLYSAMNRGKGGNIIEKILQDLGDYVEKHFRDEEVMMDEYAYPGLGEQKELHKFYEGKIIDYITDVQTGKAAVSIELLEFLKEWLSEHILVTDMKYKEFFIDKGVEQS